MVWKNPSSPCCGVMIGEIRMTFKDLKLIEPLLAAVAKQGYTAPTPIQEQDTDPAGTAEARTSDVRTGVHQDEETGEQRRQVLTERRIRAEAIHGNKSQGQRRPDTNRRDGRRYRSR